MGGGISQLVQLKLRIKQTVADMEKGIDTPAICVLAVVSLRETILHFVRSDYVADLICDGGGTMQLLKCIRYHKDDITALKNMMQLFVMLARTEKNVKLLNKAKALDTLKSIQVWLEEHTEEPTPSQQELVSNIDEGIALLRGLNAPKKAILEGIEKGDKETVVFLLRYVTTNEELVEKAFSAIFDWVQESLLFREELVEYKTHKVVITVMDRNRKNSHVMGNGAAILFELGKNPAASREIGRFGGIKVMMDVATDLTMPVETTQQIIWALSQLSNIDENLGRMKELKAKLVITELSTRTMGTVLANRDKKGRRGRAARVSATMVAHGGIPSPIKKAKPKNATSPSSRTPSRSSQQQPLSPTSDVDVDLLPDDKPVFFVPSKLLNVSWDHVKILHVATRPADERTAEEILAMKALPGRHMGAIEIVDGTVMLTMDDGSTSSPGKKPTSDKSPSQFKGKASDNGDESDGHEGSSGKPDHAAAAEGDSSDDDDDDDEVTEKHDDGGDEAGELTVEKAEKLLKRKAKLAEARGDRGPKFDDYLNNDLTGKFAEEQIDVRKELRRIRENKLGRNVSPAFAAGMAFGGFDPDSIYRPEDDDGRVLDPDEATGYDLNDKTKLRRDPYLQALNKELAPDLVEKFYDAKTNSVRIRRKYSVIETPHRLNHKLKKTLVPWQAKYHYGQGGIDPALQETYPLSAMMKHADENVHKKDKEGDAPHEDPREVVGPLFPSPAFSGLFRK